MAKKKKPSNDRHASSFMVRLPEVYRTQLGALWDKNRRPMTEEIKLALERYLAAEGLWPPKGEGAST